MNAPVEPSRSALWFRLALRLLLLAWAGFWLWFVVANLVSDLRTVPWWIPVAWLTSLPTLVVLGWKKPLLGGIALIAAGAWSATYFTHPGARALLAAPAVAIGIGLVLSGWSTRAVARLAVLACGLLFVSCAAQDPADLPYRTSSILRHDNGRMKRGYLVEETVLEGFPCRRWTWWYDDGRIDNLELATDFRVQEHDFPAHTRLFFDRAGRLAHAWLSEDTVLDGRPCRGRWKIDTAFHPNGRVRAFFPRRDHEVDGILCEASVFHPIYLHPDGRLRQCKLARDVELDGRIFERGATLRLDEAGHPLP